MNTQDIIGKQVYRVLKRVSGNSVSMYKQEGEVMGFVKGTDNKELWVKFKGNLNNTKVNVSKLNFVENQQVNNIKAMGDICGDNRFHVIKKAKELLVGGFTTK